MGESVASAYGLAEYLYTRKIRDNTELKLIKTIVHTELDFRFLANAVKLNKSIECLDISNCSLGYKTENFEFLQDMLANTTTLKSLLLENNKIGRNLENIKLLVKGLEANKSLETLDISKNPLSSREQSAAFADYLSNTSSNSLTELNYEDNLVVSDEESVKVFMNGLKLNKSLKTLKLGFCFYRDMYSFNYFTYLGNALKRCGASIVNLSIRGISNEENENFSLKAFCDGLAQCKNLQQLELSNCSLGPSVLNATLLAEALKSLKELRALDISENIFSNSKYSTNNSSLVGIIEALVHCEKLSQLNLESFFINTSDGFTSSNFFSSFNEAFQKMHFISKLNISSNFASCSQLSIFLQTLNCKEKRNLTELNLASNKIGEQSSMEAFAKEIEANRIITILDLSNNKVSLPNMKFFSRMLKNNSNVEVLKINNMKFRLDHMIHLCDGLRENKRIREMHFNDLIIKHDVNALQEIEAAFICFLDFLKDNETIDTIKLEGFFLSFLSSNDRKSYFSFFCESLKQNKKLENIYLYGNNLVDVNNSSSVNLVNLDAIESLLDVNEIIKTMIITGNRFEKDQESMKKILVLIKKFPSVNFGYDEGEVREMIFDYYDHASDNNSVFFAL